MVHCFKLFGDNIAYDANANSLHVVSDVTAEIISVAILFGNSHDGETSSRVPLNDGFYDAGAFRDIKRRYGAAETHEAVDEINNLAAVGQIFVPDDEEPGAESLAATYVFKSMCMHMAHDCNMRCAYCFASGGKYGMKRELMSYETACAAIDFISAASVGRTNIEIDFFGGEPLLDYDVIKQVVDYAKKRETEYKKNFRFTLTTNALLLDDEKINFINENIDNLVLSIDGRKEVHDAVRKRVDGSGTYGEILKKIKAATVNRDASWYVRGTYTHNNMDFANDVLHLADLGLDRISVEPVVSPPDPALGFTQRDAAAITAEYERLALAMREREMQGRPVDFFHFKVDLEGGPCLARRVKGCGAGYEYVAVAPDGGIYPCHQFAGLESFRLGDVYAGITNHAVTMQFKDTSIYTKPECRGCWAKYLCGGGCAANAWQNNGDINKPDDLYCGLFRKRMECALWLKCAAYAAPAGEDGDGS